MRPEPAPTPDRGGITAARFADACHRSIAGVRGAESPRAAVEAALDELHEALDGAFVSAFVLEHGRLWTVGQRGYSVVPDGMSIEQGVTGRAVRLEATQFVQPVADDPDFVSIFPGITCELAVPLTTDYGVVGLLNIETPGQLPAQAPRLVRKLALALGPAVGELRAGRRLDLGALARLFVHLSSLRDPLAIAEIAAASLSRVLAVETVQLLVYDDNGELQQLSLWRAADGSSEPLAGSLVQACATASMCRHRSSCSATAAGLRPSWRGPEQCRPSSFPCVRTARNWVCWPASAGGGNRSRPSKLTLQRCSAPTRQHRSTPHCRWAASATARSPIR